MESINFNLLHAIQNVHRCHPFKVLARHVLQDASEFTIHPFLIDLNITDKPERSPFVRPLNRLALLQVN